MRLREENDVQGYRPGDFLLHTTGKQYEVTTQGAIAIAQQFDTLSGVAGLEDVEAFFRGQQVLNMYSGVCRDADAKDSECTPTDPQCEDQDLGLEKEKFWGERVVVNLRSDYLYMFLEPLIYLFSQ